MLVTPEKNSHHGNQLSASPVEEVEEEATEGMWENKTVEREQIVDEVEKNDTVEEETIEGIGENQTVEGEQDIDEEEKNDAGEEEIVEEEGNDTM